MHTLLLFGACLLPSVRQQAALYVFSQAGIENGRFTNVDEISRVLHPLLDALFQQA